jgi:hypothetical protein
VNAKQCFVCGTLHSATLAVKAGRSKGHSPFTSPTHALDTPASYCRALLTKSRPSWASPSSAVSRGSSAAPICSSAILAARAASACPPDSPDRLKELAKAIVTRCRCSAAAQQRDFLDNEMGRRARRLDSHSCVYAPEKTALINTVRGRDNWSYRLVVEQTCVENEIEITTAAVASLQGDTVDGLLRNSHSNILSASRMGLKGRVLEAYLVGEVDQVRIGTPLAQWGAMCVLNALAIAAVDLWLMFRQI